MNKSWKVFVVLHENATFGIQQKKNRNSCRDESVSDFAAKHSIPKILKKLVVCGRMTGFFLFILTQNQIKIY
jgi:hypothetical protein